MFYNVDLSRLPPTNMKQCGMSAVLTELQSLRRELRNMKHLQYEVDQLREQLHGVQAQLAEDRLKTVRLDEFPSLTAKEPSSIPCAQDSLHLSTASRSSFARKASDHRDSGAKSLPRKPQHKSFTGSSTSSTVLSSVNTSRRIDVFVSRLENLKLLMYIARN